MPCPLLPTWHSLNDVSGKQDNGLKYSQEGMIHQSMEFYKRNVLKRREGKEHSLCIYYILFTHFHPSGKPFKQASFPAFHRQGSRLMGLWKFSQMHSAGQRDSKASAYDSHLSISNWQNQSRPGMSQAVPSQSRWTTWCLTIASPYSRVL